MIYNMKELLMDKLNIIRWGLVILFIITVVVIFNLIDTKNKLEQQVLVESDSEIITKTILNKQKEIILTDKQIKELEIKIQTLQLESKCWKNQMNRLVDDLEYNLIYCNDKNNILKFKSEAF